MEGGDVGIGTAFTQNAALTVMNGNVGIGTWAPSTTLSVAGGVSGTSFGASANDRITSIFTSNTPTSGTNWLILNNAAGCNSSNAYGFAENGTIKWEFGNDLYSNGGRNFLDL